MADLDKDGRTDIVVTRADRVSAWRNTTDRSKAPIEIAWERWPVDVKGWKGATAADLDLDTWPDLVGLPTSIEAPVLNWAENDGQRLVNRPLRSARGFRTSGRSRVSRWPT